MDAHLSPVAIGILADLSGAKEKSLLPPVADRRFSRVTLASFQQLFRHVAPVVDAGTTRVEVSRPEHLFSEVFPVDLPHLGTATSATGDGRLSRLRSTWAGLRWLLDAVSDRDDSIVQVLDISWAELSKTLKRYKGTAWDQSPIFKRVHEEALATLGGFSFTLLVLDFGLSHTPTDLDTLAELERIAAAARAPCTIAGTPALLHAVEWRTIPAEFSSSWQEAASFNAQYVELRNRRDASYCVVLLPTVRPVGSGFGDWLNPGYAVAAAVGLLTSDEANSPPSSVDGVRGPSMPLDVEWKCPDGLRRELHALGLNVLDSDSVSPTALNSLRMFGDGHPPLGTMLTVSRAMNGVWQRLHELRDTPVPGREALAARQDEINAREWLRQRFDEGRRGFRVANGCLIVEASSSLDIRWDSADSSEPDVSARSSDRTFRLLIADSSGSVPDDEVDWPPEPTIVPIDERSLDDAAVGLRLEVVHDPEGGRFESTTVKFASAHDLSDLSVARQLAAGAPLVDDRRHIIDIGCYANADSARRDTLSTLARRRSGVAGLGWLSEGFQSAAGEPNPPIDLNDFAALHNDWPAVGHWGAAPSVEALIALDRLSRVSPALPEHSIETRLVAILRDVDARVAALVDPVRSHPSVCEWEARRRGLAALVSQLDSAGVSTALLRQHPLGNVLRADALVRDWIADGPPEQPVVVLGAWRQFGLDHQKLARLAQVANNVRGLLVVSIDGDMSPDLRSVLHASSAQTILLVRGMAAVTRPPATSTPLEFDRNAAGRARHGEPLLVTAAYRLVQSLIGIGPLDRAHVERRLTDVGFDVRPVGAALMADFHESAWRSAD